MLPLIVIAGPTACGKTKTAVALALKTGGDVVSADSMQVYRGMNIGTAKPTAEEQCGIPHHMIDVADPDEAFSAARYQSMATAAIEQIHAQGKVPILTGGTGFYINSIIYGNEFTPIADEENETMYRKQMLTLAEERGGAYIHGLLQVVDAETADAVHPNNIKRVARALSFYHFTGERLSAHNAAQKKNMPKYDTCYIILTMERENLYNRINVRVDNMFQQGLADEVRGLLDAGFSEGLVSMQGLGYKETARYLRGEQTIAEASDEIKLGTRRYAKRQLTWFRHRSPGAIWIPADEQHADGLAEQVLSHI